jgi:hypothetical protein
MLFSGNHIVMGPMLEGKPSHCGIRISDCGMGVKPDEWQHFGFWNLDFGSSDFGMRISDCGMERDA